MASVQPSEEGSIRSSVSGADRKDSGIMKAAAKDLKYRSEWEVRKIEAEASLRQESMLVGVVCPLDEILGVFGKHMAQNCSTRRHNTIFSNSDPPTNPPTPPQPPMIQHHPRNPG